jgi:hypothetical protein
MEEKKKLLSDINNKDLIIKNYENDIGNIDEIIENIKNKMKKINNITYLTKGFQLYLSQRINKERNKTENLFLYLTSSSMEIENLVNNLKLEESVKNRQNKEILNMKTEIDNYHKNENKLKTIYSYEKKTNNELKYNNDKINDLLNIEKECSNKYFETIKQNEYIISEACIKNEYLEKINYFYVDVINMIENVLYNLSGFCKSEMIFLFIQQFFNEYNKFLNFIKDVYNERQSNHNQLINNENNELVEKKIKNNKQKLVDIIDNINQQITIEKESKENISIIPK